MEGNWMLVVVLPLLIYGLITFYIHYFQLKLAKDELLFESKESIQTENNFTVIVPFRNEERRILPLLQSINKNVNPPQVVFVDDQSTDETERVIGENATFSYTILHSKNTGKKKALQLGIDSVGTEYVLTLDADVFFEPNYFGAIRAIHQLDLAIMPVLHVSQNWISQFWSWEYQLQRKTWASYGSCFHPITGSGANLYFSKKLYQATLMLRTDQQLASGDDHFLIEAAVNQKARVQILEKSELSVWTQAPTTILGGLNQRLRWLGKVPKRQLAKEGVFGFLLSLVQLSFYSLFLLSLYHQFYFSAIGMWLLKSDMDGIITGKSWMKKEKNRSVWMYELLYPIYLLSFLISIPVLKIRWKGREIKKPLKKIRGF